MNNRPMARDSNGPNRPNNQSAPTAGEAIRINKFLAQEGRGSRREMDKLIAEGKVLINGRTAVLGDKVREGDKVEIKFRGSIGTGNGHHSRQF